VRFFGCPVAPLELVDRQGIAIQRYEMP
jgi:hypothetical protein